MMNFNIRRPETLPGARGAGAVQGHTLANRVQGWLGMRPARDQQLRLVETLPLGPRRSVALIECNGQSFLAGLGADGVTTLVPVCTAANLIQEDGAA